jgi:polyisoprenyl-phosphate glycosyltransferase
MKKISIVAACYNESKNILNMHKRIQNIFKNLAYEYELIFIDNASTDDSRSIYEQLITQDQNVKALIMSRNFGSSQPSLFAGIKHSTGDAVVMMDGDLQDPPEVISDFIKQWEAGFDVVYGVRKKRRGNLLRRIGYKCFYRIFKWFSYLDIPLDAGDFSLMDKKVVDVIKNLNEKDLYLRGLRSWVGFKQTGVEYIREDRSFGRTSNSFLANFSWAKKAIVNFSYKPLEFISKLAIISAFSTFFLALFYIYLHFKTNTPKGFSTLLMFIFIFGTIQLLSLSIIAEYLIRIFQEVKNRPPYIVREVLDKDIFVCEILEKSTDVNKGHLNV